jgi:hypothetical protein
MREDLPTIEQIIRKGDSLGNVPMDDAESQEWFERTCAKNRQARQRLGQGCNHS